MSSWQKIVLVIAGFAAVVLVVWFQLVTAMESAVRLKHISNSLPLQHLADLQSNDTAHMVSANRSSPVMLFDDSAKLAIDAQALWDKAAKAEKEKAKGSGVSLEWQRHHHLDGSVYQKLKDRQ